MQIQMHTCLFFPSPTQKTIRECIYVIILLFAFNYVSWSYFHISKRLPSLIILTPIVLYYYATPLYG